MQEHGPGQTSKRLSDQELGELLRLIEDADSVELKLTVPHSDHAHGRGCTEASIPSTPRSAKSTSSTRQT